MALGTLEQKFTIMNFLVKRKHEKSLACTGYDSGNFLFSSRRILHHLSYGSYVFILPKNSSLLNQSAAKNASLLFSFPFRLSFTLTELKSIIFIKLRKLLNRKVPENRKAFIFLLPAGRISQRGEKIFIILSCFLSCE